MNHNLSFCNPFEDPSVVRGYEDWYNTVGRRADELEKSLLKRLLSTFPQASSVLEVGCGTGHFTRWSVSLGLEAIGLDLSAAMIREASRMGEHPYVRGDALAIPFGLDTFDLATIITTLEFVADPMYVLIELLRVTSSGLILGVLNRQSKLGRRLRDEGGPVWDRARFFSPSELIHLVRQAAGTRSLKIIWLTTLWTIWPGALPLPWGGFIGMSVRYLKA